MKSLYKLEWIKWFKNPLNLIFGIGLPILVTLVLGFLVGQYEVEGIKVINFIFPQVIILIILTQTLTALPISISASRENKQLKHLSMANISKKEYLLVQFLFNYTIYFLVFLICFLLSLIIFKLDSNYQMLLSIFFLPIFFYLFHFCLAMTIVNFSQSFKTTILVTFVIFYFLIIASGVALPLTNLPSWVKYIQILTPTGCALVILTNCANGFNQALNWADWICYLIFVGYLLGFTYLAFRYFKWN